MSIKLYWCRARGNVDSTLAGFRKKYLGLSETGLREVSWA